MLSQDFEPIEAENPNNNEQYYQPYIDQIIIKNFCCYSIEKKSTIRSKIYMQRMLQIQNHLY